jgi:hypothetical protein
LRILTNRKGISAALAVLAIFVLIFAFAAVYIYLPPQATVQQTTGLSTPTASAASCSPSTPQPIEVKDGPVSGAGALSGPGVNIFTLQNGQYSTIGGDNPGTASEPVTTGGSYSLTNLVIQFYSTGTYPLWVQVNVPATANLLQAPYLLGSIGGVGTATVQCIPSASNSKAYLWYMVAGLIESPSSAIGTPTGTSSMNDVVALVTSSTGAALTTAATVMPATTATWTVSLSTLGFAHTGAGYPITVFGSTSGTVQNYATGAVYGGVNTGSVTYQTILVVSTNDTGASISLDPATNPALSMTSVTANTVTAGSLNYVVTGFTGCTPSSTTAQTTCMSVPFDISSTKSGGHTAITFTWIGEQEPAYVIAHLTTPVLLSGYHAAGASYGLAGLAGITPTNGNDAGAPTVLIEQSFTTIQTN